MKFISKEAVIRLIIENGYGVYYLYDAVNGETLGGSHVTDGESKSYKPEQLAEHLEKLLTNLGEGQYKILLKNTYKTQTASATIYRFSIGTPGQPAQTAQAPGGLGLAEVDSRVQREVEKALALQRKEFEQEKRFMSLEMELRAVREAKQPQPQIMESLTEAIKIFGMAWMAKHAPEAMPALQAMMGEVVEEEKKNFTPPKRFD
jgi:hypothetical protein